MTGDPPVVICFGVQIKWWKEGWGRGETWRKCKNLNVSSILPWGKCLVSLLLVVAMVSFIWATLNGLLPTRIQLSVSSWINVLPSSLSSSFRVCFAVDYLDMPSHCLLSSPPVQFSLFVQHLIDTWRQAKWATLGSLPPPPLTWLGFNPTHVRKVPILMQLKSSALQPWQI